jgi:hypothetical protein
VTNLMINPAGTNANSALGQLVDSINKTRRNFPLRAFTHTGDILAARAMTEQSPFLNSNDSGQQQNGISDEMYEWLPQQTLGLMRVSSAPRYVIYCYGQALRPAPGGVVLDSGPFFDLVTNYQVVAESAARAVVSVHPHVTFTVNGPVTNYTTTVESYNVLPPN